MNRGRVVEERGGKEMDGCPLTHPLCLIILQGQTCSELCERIL
jgi:hypothetical protein